MLRGNVPPLGEAVNFVDIGKAVEAFKIIPYAETGPAPDACDVPCP